MATVTTNYTAWTAVAITAVAATLAAGEWAESTIVDNTVNKFVDALIGGTFVTGASHAASDTVEIYAYANYDTATSTDLTGSIGTGLDGTDSKETEGTDFEADNLVLVAVINVGQASKTFHWGGYSIAKAFGGVLPPKWGLMIRNNGTGAMGAGSTAGYAGIKYEVA